jgi:Transaldolase/Fructose-6-phosphate aldolase
VQRPLWASTGTKNPAYSDILYVEGLVSRDTVNTMPEATLDAFRDHGRVRPGAIREGIDAAEATLSRLAEHGITLETTTARLLQDGLAAFDADLAKVSETIEAKVEYPTRETPRRSDRSRGSRLPLTPALWRVPQVALCLRRDKRRRLAARRRWHRSRPPAKGPGVSTKESPWTSTDIGPSGGETPARDGPPPPW